MDLPPRFRPYAFALLVAAGLAVRLAFLGSWGTFDVEVQKAWAGRAATEGLRDIYGPPDREIVERGAWPPPATRFQWGHAEYFVDYPPGSIVVLGAAGTLYRALRPEMPNRPLFNACINLAPLLASVAVTAVLAWRGGVWPAVAFWLNPAVILAVPVLGYQDTIFGLCALLCVLALMDRRFVAASVLLVLSGLIKPQGALLIPVWATVILREAGAPVLARSIAAGAAAAAVVLAPWWTAGHLLSALDGCLRPLRQGTLAPLGFNVWWVAGWLCDARGGAGPLARVQTLGEFAACAGFDARTVSRVLLLLATAFCVVVVVRGIAASRAVIAVAVIVQVHAYALVGTAVHENHTFLAVLLAPLLLVAWPRTRPVLAGTSAFLGTSIFLIAGLGRRVTSQRWLEEFRMAAGLDLTVVVALLHVVLFVGLVAWAWQRPVAASA